MLGWINGDKRRGDQVDIVGCGYGIEGWGGDDPGPGLAGAEYDREMAEEESGGVEENR